MRVICGQRGSHEGRVWPKIDTDSLPAAAAASAVLWLGCGQDRGVCRVIYMEMRFRGNEHATRGLLEGLAGMRLNKRVAC